jgi:UDP-N-acetylmuramoyl-tripeptide--D-alanyl-D-alanine ligase
MDIKDLYSLYLRTNGISTDTRKIAAGSVFFALKGANFNGNKFAEEALRKGAGYAVIDENEFYIDSRTILVDDVLKTLQLLANYHRKQFDIPFIGLTGSNGKTTTKELMKAVLSTSYKVHATEGNLNNHIGVPLTLLKLKQEAQIAIIEMGANKPGDIQELCEIAEPTHGIITNIGKAHLGGFGGLEGVIKTKTELYEFLRKNGGHVFVNGEDDLLMQKSQGIQRTTYCTQGFCDVFAKNISSGLFLEIEYQNRKIHTKLVGDYNFQNALAAICVGKYFNIPDNQIQHALEQYAPDNNRSQIVKTSHNVLIMDAYNANPTSMEKAILNVAKADNVLLVLGDMKELGEWTEEGHQKIVDLIQTIAGAEAVLIGESFSQTKNHNFPVFLDVEEALRYFEKHPVKGKTVLLKGSRSMKLEMLSQVF